MDKLYLIFSMVPRQMEHMNTIIGLKQSLNKKCYTVHMVFPDGFLIDFRNDELMMGMQDYHIHPNAKYSFVFPALKLEDTLEYQIIKSTGDRRQILRKCKSFYGYRQNPLTVREVTKGNLVTSIKKEEEFTSSTFMAFLLDKPEFWLYDEDRLYVEEGEVGRPGKITDWVLEP